MSHEIFEMGAGGGLVRIDNPANGLKNNLPAGTVLHWGGNMGFPAQDFAIIRRTEGSYGTYYDTISLEDYGAHRVDNHSIKTADDGVWHGQHFFITELTLSGDELLDLVEKNKAKVRADEEVKSAKATAYSKRLAELRALKNGLLQLDDTNQNRLTTAAKNMRKELAAAFPGVKFQVKTERYSGGNNINIGWTDGPTVPQVEKITNKYSGGSFDGMVDLYTHESTAWTEVYGEGKYIFENRTYSRAFIEKVLTAANLLGTVEIKVYGESAYINGADQSLEHWARKALSEASA